jgi:translation initiation factor 3 subunit C
MSRFWAAGSSSSESESESNSDSDSSGDGAAINNKVGGAAGANKWVMSDGSESEDEVRIVKSHKDKAWAGFQTRIASAKNAMKVNDWSKIQEEFDELVKALDKAKTLIAKEGGIPKFYWKFIVDLEEFLKISLADKVSFKKLSSTNGRSLNRMKLSLRKYCLKYEREVEDFKKNPIVDDEQEER